MRLNKFLAQNTDISRRKADEVIAASRVAVNGNIAHLGTVLTDGDEVSLDNKVIGQRKKKPITILLNKPVGYVCSRNGQGSPTVYALLPKKYHHLNIAGRLDKDSSGLVVMTDDGDLLHELTHPSKHKEKVYEVILDRELSAKELQKLKSGVDIGYKTLSKFKEIVKIGSKKYKITLEEGRNRQIRKSLINTNTKVINLARIAIGTYKIKELETRMHKII